MHLGAGDSDIGRARTSEAFGGDDLVGSRAERVVVQTVRSVSIVVVGGGDGAAGALVLADRPVLDVVVSAVDRADLVAAAVAGDGTNGLTLAAGVVGAVVLENLSKRETAVPASLCHHRQWLTYVVLALHRPGVDGKVEVALGVHVTGESDVPGLRDLPALAGCHVGDALP